MSDVANDESYKNNVTTSCVTKRALREDSPLDLFEMSARIKFASGGNMSDIDVLMPKTAKWETVATVYSLNGMDAEDVADFVVKAIENYIRNIKQSKNG